MRLCGASRRLWRAGTKRGLESHAYEFIHANNPNNLFPMNFDVIIGNPLINLMMEATEQVLSPFTTYL